MGFLGSKITAIIRLPESARYYQVRHSLRIYLSENISTPFNALFRQCADLSPLRCHITCINRCWNINQLSIDYALRLRLRTRLTLIRLALIRKPWLFGVQVSRLHYRYLCLHLLFHILQQLLTDHLQRNMECSPTTTSSKTGNPPLR